MKDKRVRVIYVVSGISQEGIGSFLINVFENINRNKFEISFALATEYKQAYEEYIISNGARIYRTAEIGHGIKGKVLHFIKLIKLLKKQGEFDVVHTHMDFFNGINLLAAYIANVPIRVSHAHMCADISNLSIKKRIYNYLMIKLIKLFSNVKVGCSKSANIYINGTTNKEYNKGIVINNGINLSRFKNENKISNLNSKKISFVTVGRIEEAKNPLFIVEIIREIIKINENVQLNWVGVGSLEGKVKSLIKKYGLEYNIFMLGRKSNVSDILKDSDFMIFPSKYEGLGIVLIEAQISGVPCFISNTIPKEADLGLCTIIDLQYSAREWARIIIDSINYHNYNNILNKDKVERFDIKNTVKDLEKLYMGIIK